jgi:hypothetical protein
VAKGRDIEITINMKNWGTSTWKMWRLTRQVERLQKTLPSMVNDLDRLSGILNLKEKTQED